MESKNRNSIEKLRKQKEITQEELAIKLDVTKDYISMIERGARTPSFKLAKKIADYFNTTVDDIFFDN
ncbi:putative transcriptional regulator [Acetoanaerobium noterae]|uniref:Putative transcriptional regulator n=1 Tax=Acetoanaerobium noterae TaxID=745369 RepID=A0A1T5AL69_9FIRM|nr:helix-turn-helix transcriptional regulator [Acetoanaerobium noterae]SKB35537.1 putative transcriptional regulator [Acetoanaerobium noterae]